MTQRFLTGWGVLLVLALPLKMLADTEDAFMTWVFGCLMMAPLALLGTAIAVVAFAKGSSGGGPVVWCALAAGLWMLPLALFVPGLPVLVFALMALAVALGGRERGSRWQALPEVTAVHAVWRELRSPQRTHGRIGMALSWSPWWWLGFGVVGIGLAVGLVSAASAVGGMGPQGGGAAAALFALPFMLASLALAGGAAMMMVPVGAFLGGLLALAPVARLVHLTWQLPGRSARAKGLLVQLGLDAAMVTTGWAAWQAPTVWPSVAWGALGTVLLGVGAVHASAAPVCGGPGRAVGLAVYLVALRPLVLLRALCIRLVLLSLPMVAGWVFLVFAAAVLALPAAVLAAMLHAGLGLIGVGVGTHLVIGALEGLLFMMVAGFLAGLPLHRHSIAAAAFWPTFLQGEDQGFGRWQQRWRSRLGGLSNAEQEVSAAVSPQ